MAAARSTLKISTKDSLMISKRINRRTFPFARKFVEDLLEKKTSVNNKHCKSAATEILALLKSVENNARQKGLDPEEMILRMSVQQGPGMLRGRRKRRFGLKLKMTHVHAVLEKKEKKVEKK